MTSLFKLLLQYCSQSRAPPHTLPWLIERLKGTKLHFKSPTAERRHVLCVGVGRDRTHTCPLQKSRVCPPEPFGYRELKKCCFIARTMKVRKSRVEGFKGSGHTIEPDLHFKSSTSAPPADAAVTCGTRSWACDPGSRLRHLCMIIKNMASVIVIRVK